MAELRLDHLDFGSYAVILADPPWQFLTRSPKGLDGRPQHYRRMTLDEIKAIPVASLGAKDCALLMWVTDPTLKIGMSVLDAWGFQYKTVGFYWTKTTKNGREHVGQGYYTRANPEQCLLATRGQPRRVAKDVRRLIVAPVREHSRKPDEQYPRIERLFHGPYLELFARTTRPGWACAGDETGKFD
jgi:N6-adenosine-specific RNA methylase IME4